MMQRGRKGFIFIYKLILHLLCTRGGGPHKAVEETCWHKGNWQQEKGLRSLIYKFNIGGVCCALCSKVWPDVTTSPHQFN